MKLRFERLEEFLETDGPKLVLWFDILDDEDVFNQKYRYSMPVETFEFRIAEYGPLTRDELVEIVVAEAAMVLGFGETDDGLTTLATAPDQETARRDHLARCARVNAKWKVNPHSKDSSLAAEMKKKMLLRPAAIQEKSQQFRQSRGR